MPELNPFDYEPFDVIKSFRIGKFAKDLNMSKGGSWVVGEDFLGKIQVNIENYSKSFMYTWPKTKTSGETYEFLEGLILELPYTWTTCTLAELIKVPIYR